MKIFVLFFILLVLLSSALATVFRHQVHRKESLRMKLMKQGLWKEYVAHKQRLLHGKFSNFKSTSQNTGGSEFLEYFVNITIGTPEQTFSAFFDTGTGLSAIPDINCSVCPDRIKFNSSKSSTYQVTNQPFQGNSIWGIYGQDFVRFGNPGTDQLIIPSTMFGQLYSDFTTGINNFIGLGFTKQNPDGVDPPIINAINSGILDYPIVTIALKGQGGISADNNGGVITYGAVDTVNCDRNVVYEPLTNPDRFQIALKEASLGSTKFSGNWDVVINTAVNFILAPRSITTAFYNEIGVVYDSHYGAYTIDCDTKFNLNLTIGSTVYTLTEKIMVTNFEDVCIVELIPMDSDIWSFGIRWFESFCNVLDYQNKRIGFANMINS